MRSERCPAATGSIFFEVNPASPAKLSGVFPCSDTVRITPLPAAVPLLADGEADDPENDSEHGAKRYDRLSVHGRHPLSGLPEGSVSTMPAIIRESLVH